MSIGKLNTSEFKQVIESADNIVLVDFYADWCGPCRMVSPLVEEIAEENKNVSVYKVNIDESPDLAAEFSIMSIPTLISFKDKNVYKTLVGARPKEDIEDLLS